MNKKSFASDNYGRVHPKILQALVDANKGDAPSYGADNWTERAIAVCQRQFGNGSDVYFVATGTAANVLALNMLLKPYQAIMRAHTAHIQVDECGAPENYTGSKLLTITTGTGKLPLIRLSLIFL